MKLLLASNNTHKIEELGAILRQLDPKLEILCLSDIDDMSLDVEESGSTLEENAYLKARAFYERSGLPCIADDTGLEVDALNGAPGVHTARFAGENARYEDNVALLLEKLHGIAPEKRQASFRTVICYVDDQRTLFAEGSCKGSISEAARGDRGFGYDPVFVPKGHEMSFAELSSETKNAISHRALALQEFAGIYRRLRDDAALEEAQSDFTARRPTHSLHRHLLCRAAANAVLNKQFELQACIHEYCDHEFDLQHMYEALLQIYLFAGFPAALEALSSMRSVLESRSISWYADDSEQYDLRVFERRGRETCERIYTGVYTAMRERVLALSAHLDMWMIVEGYGKVLSRSQLDLCTRELINSTILAACGWSRQLYSHLRGALNVGADADMCEESLAIAAELSDNAHKATADAVWSSLRPSRVA